VHQADNDQQQDYGRDFLGGSELKTAAQKALCKQFGRLVKKQPGQAANCPPSHSSAGENRLRRRGGHLLD
jgi:hypothetical protein